MNMTQVIGLESGDVSVHSVRTANHESPLSGWGLSREAVSRGCLRVGLLLSQG